MNFLETVDFVKKIPYGRNANRKDFSLVISENKGTCSSKHAYLKDFATRNNIPNVQLILGIYKMNEQNTKIGSILSDNFLDFIPEAHCYLKIDGKTVDVTSKDADFDKIDYQVFELDGLDVRYRYPLAILDPEDDEVEIAIAQAEVVINFVKEKCV